MAGSDDGSVRVWKNYSGSISRDPILLTAWQALADVQPATKTSSSMYRNQGYYHYKVHQYSHYKLF